MSMTSSKMYKSSVLILLIVCSPAVNASPSMHSVDTAKRKVLCRSCGNATPTPPATATAPPPKDDAIVTDVAPLKHAIKIQSQTIQNPMEPLEAVASQQKIVQGTNHSIFERTPTPGIQALGELVTDAVNAAVLPLQKTIQELKQQKLANSMPMAQCASDEFVMRAVNEVVATLQSTIAQELNQSTTQTSAAAAVPQCAADERVTNAINAAIAPLQTTAQNLAQTVLNIQQTIDSLTKNIQRLEQTYLPSCGYYSGYMYHLQTDSCYKPHQHTARWTVAKAKCIAEGAHLVVINSLLEAEVLSAMQAQQGWNWAHIGAFLDSGVWKTVSGEIFETAAGYNPWRSGWPTKRLSDAQRKYALFSDRTVVNVDDSENHHFICEKMGNTLGESPV